LARRLDPDHDAWDAEQLDTRSDCAEQTPVLTAVGALAPDTQTDDPSSKVAGSNVGRMVELRGLEPLTFALPARRSPS
jgi:hypothetical protein